MYKNYRRTTETCRYVHTDPCIAIHVHVQLLRCVQPLPDSLIDARCDLAGIFWIPTNVRLIFSDKTNHNTKGRPPSASAVISSFMNSYIWAAAASHKGFGFLLLSVCVTVSGQEGLTLLWGSAEHRFPLWFPSLSSEGSPSF